MGGLLRDQGRLDEAEPLWREAMERNRRTLGDDHFNTQVSISNLGVLLMAQGKTREAEPLFEELYRRAATSQLAPVHAAMLMSNYALTLPKLNKHEQAYAPLTEVVTRLRSLEPVNPRMPRDPLLALIDVCERTGRQDEAAAWRAELKKVKAGTRPSTGATTVPARQS
jgi:tetratricopeptide (TPR) repeat protein